MSPLLRSDLVGLSITIFDRFTILHFLPSFYFLHFVGFDLRVGRREDFPCGRITGLPGHELLGEDKSSSPSILNLLLFLGLVKLISFILHFL